MAKILLNIEWPESIGTIIGPGGGHEIKPTFDLADQEHPLHQPGPRDDFYV